MTFAKFERADGVAYINPAYVRSVLSRTDGGSTVRGEGEWVDVLGTAADVVAALERAAAGLDEAPAAAKRHVLPLWEQDKDGDWSRGPWVSAPVWISRCGDHYCGHAGYRESAWCQTADAAMVYADSMASEVYDLPWDSMVPDLALAVALDGKRFEASYGSAVTAGIDPATPATSRLWQRIPYHLFESDRPEAIRVFVRLLRAHGAIVTEAA